MKNLNFLKKTTEELKSKAAQITGALALIAALTAMTSEANAQTIVNKRERAKIEEKIQLKQEYIGEDIAKYFYDGGIKRQLQQEITKQTTENGKNVPEEFSIFKDTAVNNINTEEDILNKKEMTDKIYHTIDSLVEKDVAAMYILFQEYQTSGIGLVGNKRGKEEEGFHLLPFKINLNINYGKDIKGFPYSKEETEKMLQKIESIYEKELSTAKAEAEKLRQTSTPEEYESALLIARAKAEKIIAARMKKEIADPIIAETFKEYYSRKGDAKANTQNSKKGW